jgi:hypothetical protein
MLEMNDVRSGILSVACILTMIILVSESAALTCNRYGELIKHASNWYYMLIFWIVVRGSSSEGYWKS